MRWGKSSSKYKSSESSGKSASQSFSAAISNWSSGSGSSHTTHSVTIQNNAAYSIRVFGIPLPTEDLASLSKGAYNPKNFIDGIPIVVYKCLKFLYKYGLRTEGLFRIPGGNSEIQELKAKFDAGDDVDLEKFGASAHEVAGLLKLYFRELPDPLLTYNLYDILQSTISSNTDIEERRKRLRAVVFLLPVVNYETLGALLKFLKKVTDFEDCNKMSSVNLAICIAPNLIKERDQEGIGHGFLNTGATTMIMKTLIDECDYIFEEDDEEEENDEEVDEDEDEDEEDQLDQLEVQSASETPSYSATAAKDTAAKAAASRDTL